MAIITAGHDCSPLKVLLATLIASIDALLGAVHGDIRRRLLVTARCRLPASLCRVKHDRLIVGGVLGGDAARLLKHVLEEVAMSALLWVLCAALRQRTHAALASLAVNLGLIALTLLSP
jgi:hypothetical protein